MPYIFSGSTSRRVHADQVTYRSVSRGLLLKIITLLKRVDGDAIDQLNAALQGPSFWDRRWDGFLPQHPGFGSISWADKPGHAEMGSVTTSTTGSSSKADHVV